MTKEIEFHYGILAPSLKEQAEKQGFLFIDKENSIQKAVDAMNRLYFNDYLSDSEHKKIMGRIHKDAIKKLSLRAEKEASK